jgi:hypothetical protein
MDPNLKIALIAAASAIGGGVITAIVAPHIAWGIEKRKQKLDLRKKLVADWRRMINWVVFQYEHQPEGSNASLVEVLEGHEDYFSLKPHLCNSVLNQINTLRDEVGSIRIVQSGKTKRINPPSTLVSILVKEIARIEKEWDLV